VAPVITPVVVYVPLGIAVVDPDTVYMLPDPGVIVNVPVGDTGWVAVDPSTLSADEDVIPTVYVLSVSLTGICV
jgi:hypothetical protein